MGVQIGGSAEPGWGAVHAAFEANFAERGEVGAAVCVYVDGRPVVDLWGGHADPEAARPWEEDTIVCVFSSTKGVTATGVHVLVERGLLDPDRPVAAYWPEFAAAGKGDITVRQVLAHRAGLPYVEGDFTLEEALSWEPIVAALAGQRPAWEPGTRHGYHMRTFGWLVGELVRRVTGRSAGTFLREDVLGPLGLDFWVGLPAELEPRVAPVVPPRTSPKEALSRLGDASLLARVFANPSDLFDYDEMWNSRQLHAAELPSSNGIGDARGLARLYASCVGDGVDGRRTLTSATVDAATRVESLGTDAVTGVESCFGLGYMLGTTFGVANPPTAFGHVGAGGSLAFGDPASGLALGYVMNDLRFGPGGDPRSESLVRAALAVVGPG